MFVTNPTLLKITLSAPTVRNYTVNTLLANCAGVFRMTNTMIPIGIVHTCTIIFTWLRVTLVDF